MDAAETFRLLLCAHCRQQIRLCQQCDPGQRFCSSTCAAAHRRRAQREASRRYQRTFRGARLHAARMQRHRDRKCVGEGKFVTPKVTQQSETQASAWATHPLLAPDGLVGAGEEAQSDASTLAMQPARDTAAHEVLLSCPQGDLLKAQLDTSAAG
jgi:hypothetical protein